MVAELLATACAGLFAGAAIYISLVEHPARLECGSALALREFGPSYRRAAVMQALLAFVGFAAGTAAWLRGASPWWLVGGLFLGAVIPFTLVVIFPTNERLLDPTLDPTGAEADALLRRWGRLHGVRSLSSLVAFLILLAAAAAGAQGALPMEGAWQADRELTLAEMRRARRAAEHGRVPLADPAPSPPVVQVYLGRRAAYVFDGRCSQSVALHLLDAGPDFAVFRYFDDAANEQKTLAMRVADDRLYVPMRASEDEPTVVFARIPLEQAMHQHPCLETAFRARP